MKINIKKLEGEFQIETGNYKFCKWPNVICNKEDDDVIGVIVYDTPEIALLRSAAGNPELYLQSDIQNWDEL